MTSQILAWLQQVKSRFEIKPASILEVGSLNVNGSPRGVFPEIEDYLGIDLQAGPGVDLIWDIQSRRLDRLFDCVICCEALEHDRDPVRTAAAIRSHCQRWLLITTPGNGFAIHRYPRDYWRLLPDAFEDLLFEGFRILDFSVVGSNSYCCLGGRQTVQAQAVKRKAAG